MKKAIRKMNKHKLKGDNRETTPEFGVELKPLISIIIPTYNRSKLLTNCITNCLEQTYDNIEILVIDDGSTDATSNVVAELSRKDARIICFKKVNEGLARALNYGFRLAKGDYLTWTSDDNYYAKDAIYKMLKFILNKNCAFVYCNYFRFKKDSPEKLRLYKLPNSGAVDNDNRVGPCFMYSREVWKKTGEFNPETILAEDYDYWIRVSKKFTMCHLNEALYFYMEHEDSFSLRFTKEYDILIISILVRLKNDIVNIKKAIELFSKFIFEKFRREKPKRRGFQYLFQRLMSNQKFTFLWEKIWFLEEVFRFIIKVRYAQKIILVLRDFKSKTLNIHKSRFALKKILGNYNWGRNRMTLNFKIFKKLKKVKSE